MTTNEFIKQAIGNKVYITSDGDLGIDRSLRGLISNKTPLILVKLTKAGYAYVYNGITKKYHSIPPSNIREIGT